MHAETHVHVSSVRARVTWRIVVPHTLRPCILTCTYTTQRHAQRAQAASGARICDHTVECEYVSRTWQGRRVGVTCTYTRYTHSLTGFYTARLSEDQASILRRNTPVPTDPKSHCTVFFLPLSAYAVARIYLCGWHSPPLLPILWRTAMTFTVRKKNKLRIKYKINLQYLNHRYDKYNKVILPLTRSYEIKSDDINVTNITNNKR